MTEPDEKIETRQFTRFRSATGTALKIKTSAKREHSADLLDVNRAGGMGILLRFDNSSLTLRDLFDPLFALRTTKDGETIELPIFVLGIVEEKAQNGMRLSVVTSQEALDSLASPTTAKRRRTSRLSVTPRVVVLDREGHEFIAKLTNYSDDDGLGLVVMESDIPPNITVGDLFAKVWLLSYNKMPYTCSIRRIGVMDRKLILGAYSSEIIKVLSQSKESAELSPAGASTEDELLLEMLNKITESPILSRTRR